MLGISFPELLVILAVAFLVVGPARLAESAHQIGTLIGKLKTQWNYIKQTQLSGLDSSSLFDTEIELNKTINEIKKETKLPS